VREKAMSVKSSGQFSFVEALLLQGL